MMFKQYEAAAVSADRALALQSQHFNNGLARLELRHFEVAEQAFNAALAIKPDMAELLAPRVRLYLLF
jgi:hypothetical protein